MMCNFNSFSTNSYVKARKKKKSTQKPDVVFWFFVFFLCTHRENVLFVENRWLMIHSVKCSNLGGKYVRNQETKFGVDLFSSGGYDTHGRDSGLLYILPNSGTPAGSPEWCHTFLRSNSSCHKSSSHRRALRNQCCIDRWAYLVQKQRNKKKTPQEQLQTWTVFVSSC